MEAPGRQQDLAVGEKGYGKRTLGGEYRGQGRGGLGVIAVDASERNGDVVDVVLVREGDQLMVVTNRGQFLRTFVSQIRLAGRNTQGVRIIGLKEGESVVAVEGVEAAVGIESDGTEVEASRPSLIPPAGEDGESGPEDAGSEASTADPS